MSDLSTKPYLVRALYEWCIDAGYTPYLSVAVDDHTRVPREFVRDGQIVLNISPLATHGLVIDADWVSFQARFGGIARELVVPIGNVQSIYARETGQGMAFEVEPHATSDNPAAHSEPRAESESPRAVLSTVPAPMQSDAQPDPPTPPSGPRPHLKRVK